MMVAEDIREKIFGLSGAAREVLRAMFLSGPIADGDLPSKTGRSELYKKGYCFIWNGWQSLTATGMRFAIEVMMLDREKERRDMERRRASR